MAGTPLKTFDAGTLARWRKWLAANVESAREVWVIFHKKHTGRPSLDYFGALDEALCYGWIDCGVRRIDDDRFARKFTPRRPGSKWSAINRKRYAALEAAGRLAPAGKARSPKGAVVARPPKLTLPSKLPAYIANAIKAVPVAWEYFNTLAPSHRRRYVGWIHMAKREETRQRRLHEAIRLLSANQKLGLK
jgi:uncharacterized protein YdeI (YjbR/CyaY-like superfamily)